MQKAGHSLALQLKIMSVILAEDQAPLKLKSLS
jgi:hypothetical protein